MSDLKVGFHAFLLHQYQERLQTYSHLSWVLLVKMPDGNFFNRVLFKNLSKKINVPSIAWYTATKFSE